jgi:hypothetical protein
MSELNNGEAKERRAFECLPTEQEDACTSELIPHLLLNQRRSCHFANDVHNKVRPDEHLICALLQQWNFYFTIPAAQKRVEKAK